MNKIDSKNKKFMIFGIIILVIAVVSSTLAYYIWSSGEQIKISTTVGVAYVYFDGGSAIENATLRPVADKSKGITKNISMRADATGVTANVYLDLVTLPNSLKDVSFRYAIYNGSTLAKEGNFSSTSLSSSTSTCTANSTTHITLLSNVSVPITKTTYTLYIWIDGANYTNPKSMMNQTFSFKLHADGTGAILNNEYELTNSDGNTYTPTYNGSGTKTIRSSAPLSKFKEVKVDNAVVDSSNYTLTEGSTIITFKESYLKTLSEGEHALKIISTDGFTSGKIIIKNVKLIEFKVTLDVETTSFIAEEGMTWKQFINSSYNVDSRFKTVDGKVGDTIIEKAPLSPNYVNVNETDLIVNECRYYSVNGKVYTLS